MKVLECFTIQQPKLSLSEISKMLEMEPSTVRRILMSLEEGDFVKQDPETRMYSLDNGLVRLGAIAIQNFDIRSIAKPYMKEVSDRSQENTYLAINSADQSLYIDIVEAKQEIVLTGSVGATRPLYSTGTGKVLLAFLPEQEIESIFKWKMSHLSDEAISRLREDIVTIQKKGVAVAVREYNQEVFSIAAPIFDSTNRVVAALAISGPAFRLTEEKVREFEQVVIANSNEISTKMGYSN